jgi:hypothetical protein
MRCLPKISLLTAGVMLCVFAASTNAQDDGPVLPEPPALEKGDETILPVPAPEPKAKKKKKKKRGLFRRIFDKDEKPKKPSRPTPPPQPGVEIGAGRGVIFGGPNGVQFGGGVGAKFGGSNGVQFGGGQGAKFGGSGGVQFGGGQGAKFGPRESGGPYGDPVRRSDASKRRSPQRPATPRRVTNGDTITLNIPAEAKGAVECWIGRLQLELKPGEIVELPADRSTVIRFTPRKGAEPISYSLPPGHYQFKQTRKGWNLYKASAPAPPRPTPGEPTIAAEPPRR